MHRTAALLVSLFAAVTLAGCTPATVDDPAPFTGVSTEDTPTPDAITEAPAPEPTILEAKNIKLTLKIISKQCYGDQGCNYDVKVKAVNYGPPLSDEDTWEVSYKLTGDEGGPIIGTLEVTGNEYSVPEEMVSTNRNSVTPKVKVTGVEKVGV